MEFKRTILVADDQLINRRILEKILGDTYRVLAAEDGEGLLRLLEQEPRVSAVLLDLAMPGLDGYGVLRAMQANPRWADIPVVVATQLDDDATEAAVLASGASDFVSKPYKPEVIRQRLRNLIQLQEATTTVHVLQHDRLTGLLNKQAFVHSAELLLHHGQSKDALFLSLNVEQFKLVNDIYGTAAGDRLLCHLGRLITQLLQPEGALCARFTADEFLAFCHGEETLGERVTAELNRRLRDYPLDMRIQLKCGVYAVEDPNMAVLSMCDRAILAGKLVKGHYGQNCAVYDDTLRQRLLREQSIVSEMERALQEDQFHVYLQPKYDLATERVAGAEALVRWTHPELGVMSPGEFIPLFERNGFITRLDIHLWEKTCAIVGNMLCQCENCVPVSVNVSRRDLYNPGLPAVLLGMLHRHKLSPQNLHLEITESAYMENPRQLVTAVAGLRELGFLIEMDDFGSGYSSLHMLSEIPVDILKLDMRFVRSEHDTGDNRNILNFVITLAKWMDLRVVAEGVETRRQIDLLRSMGCDYVQGHYYAEALEPARFFQLLRDEAAQLPLPMGAAGSAAVTSHAKPGKSVLIVDHIPADRAVLADFFAGNYTIVETGSAAAAYEYAASHGESVTVVLLSLNLPAREGYGLLSRLRENAELRGLPVVAIANGGSDETEALELGAADVICKPYQKLGVTRRVENVIHASAPDLRSRRALLEKLRVAEQAARTDPLTGLANRLELERQVKSFLEQHPGQRSVFLMLDIDFFKRVNDDLGHLVGDQVICRVSRILRGCFREEDVVSRMGGDEYAVFVKSGFTQSELHQRLTMLNQRLRFSEKTLDVSCSVGACVLPEFARDYETAYQHADMALISAKRQGRNCYRIFGEDRPPATP